MSAVAVFYGSGIAAGMAAAAINLVHRRPFFIALFFLNVACALALVWRALS